jgi:hypothetical protein
VANKLNLLSSSQTSRDENLEAKLPGGGGRVKEERKRERFSERPVVSLTRTTPTYNQRGFHRVVPAKIRMARQFFNQLLENLKLPIADWRIHHIAAYADFPASVCGRRAGKVERRAESSV